MPNRILKETICTSCEIDNLSLGAERLFYRLIVQCDDFGRMDARLPIIRAKCFPLKLDKVKDADVKKWLKEISDAGLIKIYTVDSKPYLYFVNWSKHQQKRANYSKYPAPDDGVISDDINCNQSQEDVPEKRESRIEKREYAPAVFMKEEEHQKLIERLGDVVVKDYIERLSLYKKSKGKKYKCDYSTILAWVRRDDAEKPTTEKETYL